MKRFMPILLVAAFVGCSRSPSRERLIGRWESSDKQHSLTLQADGKFSHTTGPSPATATDKETGVIYIAPVGNWSLSGRKLTISMSLDGAYEPGSDMVLHILNLTDQDVKMRFGELDPPFTLTRSK